MKILLTGYSGFLGRHLARALKRERYSIRVVLHQRTVRKKDLAEEVDEVLWGSLDNPDIVKRAVCDVDIVVHSAWKFSSPSSPRPTINERAAELLFKESLGSNVKSFVFISSVAVYGMTSGTKSLVDESSPLAMGKDLSFIYPSEKIDVEHMLQSGVKKTVKLGIFRPGPIFDDEKSPAKKIVKIGKVCLGIGLGNGGNHMAYIHAKDVTNAIVIWLKKGQNNAIFNVTPSLCMRHKDWYRNWGRVHDLRVIPVFIHSLIIRFAYFGVKVLKKILRKESKGDVNYAIACATRDKQYSNKALKRAMGWTDNATARYTRSSA